MKLSEMERKLIDNRTGIIHKLGKTLENKMVIGLIPMQMFNAYNTDILDWDSNVIVPTSLMGGLGYDFSSIDKAKERAVGESIERYCSMIIDRPILKSKVENIKNKINVFDITRCTDNQIYTNNLNLKKVSSKTELYWVRGNDELNKEMKWIPVELVYLKKIYNHQPIREMTSTGLATGTTLFDAKVNGMLECIERDAFVVMWQNRLSMPIINHQSIENQFITNVLDQIKELGLEITILDITNDIKVASYLTVIRNNIPPYITVGASTDLSPEEALLSSIREASACYNLNVNAYLEGYMEIKDTDFNSYTNFEHHSAYYAYQENVEATDFLFQGETVDFQDENPRYITKFDDLLQHLESLGIDSYTVDITSNDIKKTGLYVVRVIMPSLAFLEISHPMLNCERIFNVPAKLGYDSNILNPYPHPFP
ncbi:YcaO-like family protein [Lentibacillus salicampi]|uniref:YcaO domain-containing protein n=1 Tax=Lentibacillus salicampi TaxID=175306 RepID=A0A4Y9ABZ3_9BACI|nr:YcaO-like family protein [Lentibacillus salicampi]TFJ91904.1 hypothetical protein E4U82_15090 [Lentibacillus salicampi]